MENKPHTRATYFAALLMTAGGLMPWQRIHPDVEDFYLETFRFSPNEWLWKVGVIALGTGALVLQWRSRAQHRKIPERAIFGVGVAGAAWMLAATMLIGTAEVDFEFPTPTWFLESTIPWIGFYVAWAGVALLLVTVVMSAIRRD